MSGPRYPFDPLRPPVVPGAADANETGPVRLPPPTAAGADPPIIDEEDRERQPNCTDEECTSEPIEPPAFEVPRLQQPARGKRLVRKADTPAPPLTAEQRLLLLDTWRRSGLPAGDFAALVGLSKHTLYAWKQRFEAEGPAGLADKPKGGPQGSRLPEVTRRAILMLKEDNPDWGCERISAMLLRGPALPASPQAVAKVLHEAGYQTEETPTHRHPDKVRRFERARANQLWQTDLFTFVLKRQNRRVYLVAFMDDHSRFLVGYGLHASQSAALVMEVFRAGVASYGPPEEVLTDNGSQYVTWRGKSAFTKELEKRGVRQVVASPRPNRPFPILAVNGEQGSAKSPLCKIGRALIDPNLAPLRRPPREDRDLLIAATNGWIVGFDNLSGIAPALSDALCLLATGGGFGIRESAPTSGVHQQGRVGGDGPQPREAG